MQDVYVAWWSDSQRSARLPQAVAASGAATAQEILRRLGRRPVAAHLVSWRIDGDSVERAA